MPDRFSEFLAGLGAAAALVAVGPMAHAGGRGPDARIVDCARAEASPPSTSRPPEDGKTMASHGRPGLEPATPGHWVARIVTMRKAGADDSADHELAALHARYPAFVIPKTALCAGSR